MDTIQQLNLDSEELKTILEKTTRPRNQLFLTREINRLQKEIENLQRPSTTTTIASAAAAAPPPLPTTKITTYAWDQSDEFLKLYLTVPGATSEHENRVKTDFKTDAVELNAVDIAGKNYQLIVKDLLHPVNPDASKIKVKKDQILVMLKKQKTGTSWPYVTATEQRTKDKKPDSKPKMDETTDPNAGLMTLMKQMYDEGDDEMKRSIKKAWCESQDKKKDLGSGDMMGDF